MTLRAMFKVTFNTNESEHCEFSTIPFRKGTGQAAGTKTPYFAWTYDPVESERQSRIGFWLELCKRKSECDVKRPVENPLRCSSTTQLNDERLQVTTVSKHW